MSDKTLALSVNFVNYFRIYVLGRSRTSYTDLHLKLLARPWALKWTTFTEFPQYENVFLYSLKISARQSSDWHTLTVQIGCIYSAICGWISDGIERFFMDFHVTNKWAVIFHEQPMLLFNESSINTMNAGSHWRRCWRVLLAQLYTLYLVTPTNDRDFYRFLTILLVIFRIWVLIADFVDNVPFFRTGENVATWNYRWEH